MDAIIMSNKEFADLLIEKGANISYADDENVTVTTQAAYQGLTEVVQKLIDKGADITVANNEGINPLIAAASEGYVEIVKLLLATDKLDTNAKDKDGTNALMAAAVRGHKDIVDLLIVHKADINAQNIDGHTALMFAYNGKNQVQSLLDKYREYMTDSNDNSTKIMNDALKTHEDVVTILLEHGADPSLQVDFKAFTYFLNT